MTGRDSGRGLSGLPAFSAVLLDMPLWGWLLFVLWEFATTVQELFLVRCSFLVFRWRLWYVRVLCRRSSIRVWGVGVDSDSVGYWCCFEDFYLWGVGSFVAGELVAFGRSCLYGVLVGLWFLMMCGLVMWSVFYGRSWLCLGCLCRGWCFGLVCWVGCVSGRCGLCADFPLVLWKVIVWASLSGVVCWIFYFWEFFF